MASKRELGVGDGVQVMVSEPWEFESEVGTGQLHGQVAAHVTDRLDERPALLIRLAASVTFQGLVFDALLALPRYRDERIGALDPGERAVCNLVPGHIEGERFAQAGASHLIGTVEFSP